MQIENIARICFTARRTTEQERHLTICPGLLREVIENDQRILAFFQEILAHRGTRVGGDVLHGRGVRCRRSDDDSVLHCTFFFELSYDAGNRRGFLADRDIDTFDACATLVDDRIDSKRGLAGLPVADDQFALATTNRHHGVNRLQPGLYRLADRLTGNNARRDFFDRRKLRGLNRSLAIDRVAERIDDPAQKRFTDRDFENAPRCLNRVTLGDVLVIAKHYRADRVLLEIQRQAVRVLRKLEHFTVPRVGQSVNAHDTVGNADDSAHIACFSRCFEILDSLFNQLADFRSLECHFVFLFK